jgi:hypothetical protein
MGVLVNLDHIKTGVTSTGWPAKPAPLCADCAHWLPSAVILQGNTRGTCDLHRIPASADDHCSDFARATPKPRTAP